MTKTASTMMPLGTCLPFFDLPVINNPKNQDYKWSQDKSLSRVESKIFTDNPLLIMVICAHCPFVKHIEKQITSLHYDYRDSIDMIAISSNSFITHPQDAPEYLAEQARKNSWYFPYLLDHDQSLAKGLRAACTPDFFLFSPLNSEQKLCYRGQLDESRPGNNLPVNGSYIRAAMDALLQAKPLCIEQKPSIGCNIKWHPGKEPYWFD